LTPQSSIHYPVLEEHPDFVPVPVCVPDSPSFIQVEERGIGHAHGHRHEIKKGIFQEIEGFL
jgi:hypothetical protein